MAVALPTVAKRSGIAQREKKKKDDVDSPTLASIQEEHDARKNGGRKKNHSRHAVIERVGEHQIGRKEE